VCTGPYGKTDDAIIREFRATRRRPLLPVEPLDAGQGLEISSHAAGGQSE
jgi:hypothetical protein